MNRRLTGFITALCLCAPAGAEPVPPGYVQVATEYAIPPEILYAVASAETGLRLPSGITRPWPWTLNVEGKGERYRTRLEAYQAIQAHLAEGRRSIDIGLMQVNWRWHHRLLLDPWMALDPYFNLRVGAHILRERYQESPDWLIAVGRYHSPANRARAQAYRARVVRRLERLGRG